MISMEAQRKSELFGYSEEDDSNSYYAVILEQRRRAAGSPATSSRRESGVATPTSPTNPSSMPFSGKSPLTGTRRSTIVGARLGGSGYVLH